MWRSPRPSVPRVISPGTPGCLAAAVLSIFQLSEVSPGLLLLSAFNLCSGLSTCGLDFGPCACRNLARAHSDWVWVTVLPSFQRNVSQINPANEVVHVLCSLISCLICLLVTRVAAAAGLISARAQITGTVLLPQPCDDKHGHWTSPVCGLYPVTLTTHP